MFSWRLIIRLCIISRTNPGTYRAMNVIADQTCIIPDRNARQKILTFDDERCAREEESFGCQNCEECKNHLSCSKYLSLKFSFRDLFLLVNTIDHVIWSLGADACRWYSSCHCTSHVTVPGLQQICYQGNSYNVRNPVTVKVESLA